jgi:EAL domain-containing protein (putative c-di-GMP-specific phosphodiesterase class I)
VRDESSRSRSAKHYLVEGSLTARLETVLTLVSQAVGFPTARVNILDDDTQHTISLFGVGEPGAVDRSEAFCDTVVNTGVPVVVPDATRDPRFASFPTVVDGDIGSYLGVPLIGRESLVVGAICVIDSVERHITPAQLQLLTDFGKVVEDQLDLIRRLREQRIDGDVATAEIARALADGEIVPWYQPIVDLATGRLLGYEALARWEHPTLGVEDPRQFVPIAEDSDLIIELDLTVMRRALCDLKRWQQTEPSLRMSVNLCARHLHHADCADALVGVASAAGVDPRSVTLELTETSRLDPRNTHVPRIVHQLRQQGFQIWLDDFGTGWSSLDQLLWLPVDGIKIDRAVTVALGTPVGDALLAAVTGISAALGLRTTIEGIETSAAADLARRQGCDHGQGYLWSRPTPGGFADPSPPSPAHVPYVTAGSAQSVRAKQRKER